jgi:hypothetical protein
MTPLNAHQRRHVLSTFAHVDGLLRTVERIARGDDSPFARERTDLTRDEAVAVERMVSLTRERMLAALEELAIPLPARDYSARWSIQTTLDFAELALSDLGGEELRGFGQVDEDARQELLALVAQVRGALSDTRHRLDDDRRDDR